jgi:hypothetical protein
VSDFSTAWTLSRQRLVDEVKDLSDEQLQWRPHASALSIGQMAIHVAGVEMLFSSQLLGESLSAEEQRVKNAATEGVVNATPFPFSDDEITRETVGNVLLRSKQILETIITAPSEEILVKQIKSALGPIVSGEAAFARLCFHPAYHQGQAYLMKTDPNFPA